MKLRHYFFLIISCFLIFISCSKDNGTQNESYYVDDYSGVLIGSSGVYILTLSENGCTAKIIFDGSTYNLSTNTPLLVGGSVTLTDGTVSITLTDNNGNIEIEFDIPNHTIQSTIVLSNPNNPNRNYIGWSENFRNGVKVYRTTINLVLSDNNQWSGIEKIDVDINPDDPNHESTEGDVNYVNGIYTENTTSVTFKWSNGQEIFTLNKINNTLHLFENGTTTFEAELTLTE